jgi:ABC-type antimicrobial peptide transport system permease subunit
MGGSMRRQSLTRASLGHYLPTNIMVVVGIAASVAVLAGALLVGASVRESLRSLALGRLGATDVVVSSQTFFRSDLSDNLVGPSTVSSVQSASPLILAAGAVVHDQSKRTAGRVVVYGIDERFERFHGVTGLTVSGRDALVSGALAGELGVQAGESLTVRIARPSDIPLSTLQGRRELTGERLRVTVARVLDQASLSEFSLAPAQGPVFAVFVPIARLQRDLELGDRVNTILLNLDDQITADQAIAIVNARISSVATLGDLGLRVRPRAADGPLVIEGSGGFIVPSAVEAIEKQAAEQKRAVVPVLTYVANSIRIGSREVPYSTVTAIDFDAVVAKAEGLPGLSTLPPIWLNEWAASDLNARVGDEVTLDYFLWSDEEGLQTRSATFALRAIVPMKGIGGDQTLTPEYPGISDAADISSWDPPFPVDLAKVRRKDEDYWDRYRAAPKAIVTLADGQRLWGSRFGSVSSLRIDSADAEFLPRIDPSTAGLSIRHVRAEALAASTGTTDFGQYFLYFSFFLVVSALLLSYLFFALGLEQRTREVGVLAALGFTPAAIRGTFVREGAVLASLGALVGAFAALGYGAFIMYGLRTWWVGAVGTTALSLHASPRWLAIGVAGAVVAGLMALWLGVRTMSRRSTRALLTGTRDLRGGGSPLRSRIFAIALATVGALLLVGAAYGAIDATAGFFGAGGSWLLAGLFAAALLLRRGLAPALKARQRFPVVRLGTTQTAAAPARSVLSLALIAFACFVLVTVGAFRRDADSIESGRSSGTGGYSLMAESVAPLMYDPNTARGRTELGLEADDPVLSGVHITRVRLRPGDEASCLTLYKPMNPRIIALESSFVDEARFTFGASLATTPEDRANPWRLLNRTFEDGAVAAVADQTTLTYALHLKVGDDFVFTPDGHVPVRLRIVGALADSVLQSEVVIGEAAFVRLFPRNEGHRVWLIDGPPSESATITAYLEDRLSDSGLDVVDTRSRLASYHQVENTYLATFQALGGLGLLLGTVGLGAVLARNVLERRREMALLGAVGFMPGDLRVMVLSESLTLVVGGVALGTLAAIVAILPALRERAQSLPIGELAALLLGVVVTGLLSSLLAVRMATGTRIVEALKAE